MPLLQCDYSLLADYLHCSADLQLALGMHGGISVGEGVPEASESWRSCLYDLQLHFGHFCGRTPSRTTVSLSNVGQRHSTAKHHCTLFNFSSTMALGAADCLATLGHRCRRPGTLHLLNWSGHQQFTSFAQDVLSVRIADKHEPIMVD